MKAIDKEAKICSEIEQMLLDNHIGGVEFVDYTINTVVPHFPACVVKFFIDGDWKHDHLYADELVKRLYGAKATVCDEEEVEDTGSDWYSSVHVYSIVL